MSAVTWLASDYPLKQLEVSSEIQIVFEPKLKVISGFGVTQSYYTFNEDFPKYAEDIKPYRYEICWDEEETTLSDMKSYLHDQVRIATSVEIWHFWIGGIKGFYNVKQRKCDMPVKTKHIDSYQLAMAEDDASDYFDLAAHNSYETIETTINDLSHEHLKCVESTFGICLVIHAD